jgi:hypothetical protein
MPNQEQSNLEKTLDLVAEEAKALPDSDGEGKLGVDESLKDVYERAIMAFEEQVNNASIVDPRYAARNMEVAKMFLDSAMEALKLRNSQDQHKDKIEVAKAKLGRLPGKTINNNLIVADRNDILRRVLETSPPREKQVVDIVEEEELIMEPEFEEVKEKKNET